MGKGTWSQKYKKLIHCSIRVSHISSSLSLLLAVDCHLACEHAHIGKVFFVVIVVYLCYLDFRIFWLPQNYHRNSHSCIHSLNLISEKKFKIIYYQLNRLIFLDHSGAKYLSSFSSLFLSIPLFARHAQLLT